jgi:hypothetical protein
MDPVLAMQGVNEHGKAVVRSRLRGGMLRVVAQIRHAPIGMETAAVPSISGNKPHMSCHYSLFYSVN